MRREERAKPPAALTRAQQLVIEEAEFYAAQEAEQKARAERLVAIRQQNSARQRRALGLPA